MTKYIVKTTSITYKYIEANSREQAEEFALGDSGNELVGYQAEKVKVEVEEDYDD